MITVLGSRTSGNTLCAFGTRRASGLSRRFRSRATRSSAAETRLFRDWFLVAVATTAIRHGILKHPSSFYSIIAIAKTMVNAIDFYNKSLIFDAIPVTHYRPKHWTVSAAVLHGNRHLSCINKDIAYYHTI